MEHSSTIISTPKREVIVGFRLTATEAAHIDSAGAALKRPRVRADFCRAMALHAARQRVPEPAKPIRLPARRLPMLDIQLLSKLLAELGKIGANVNQMARVTHNSEPTIAVLAAVVQDIADIRDAVITALRGGSVDETNP